MDDFREAMQGIECRHSNALIDELPGAYKDIDTVIERSKDLVRGGPRAAAGAEREGCKLQRRRGTLIPKRELIRRNKCSN
jgi:hypothetical protein